MDVIDPHMQGSITWGYYFLGEGGGEVVDAR